MDQQNRKRRRGTDRWDDQRSEIERLYLELDMTLKEVMVEMSKPPRGFHATEQAYKKKLGQWSISKNVPAAVIQEILNIEDERRLSGKDTKFYWHGVLVEAEKIRRTQKRLTRGAVPRGSGAPLKHLRYSTPQAQAEDVDTPQSMDIDQAVTAQQPDDTPENVENAIRPRSLRHSSLLAYWKDQNEGDLDNMRSKIYREPSEAMDLAVISALEPSAKDDAEDSFVTLLDILIDAEYFLNVTATFELLRGITSSLKSISDEMPIHFLRDVLAAQERQVGLYLFVYGRYNPSYLSQCLLLCYFAVLVDDWHRFGPLFSTIALQAPDLDWPLKDISTLARIATAFLDLESTRTDALHLLKFVIGYPSTDSKDWSIPTRLNVVQFAQEQEFWEIAEKVLLSAIEDCMEKPEAWPRLRLADLIHAHKWLRKEPKLVPLANTFQTVLRAYHNVEDIRRFFSLAKTLIDHEADSAVALQIAADRVLSYLNSNTSLDDKLAQQALVVGALSVLQKMETVDCEAEPVILVANTICEAARRYLDPQDKYYVNAHQVLSRIEKSRSEAISKAKESNAVNRSSQMEKDSHDARGKQKCSFGNCKAAFWNTFSLRLHIKSAHEGVQLSRLDVPTATTTSTATDIPLDESSSIRYERGRTPQRDIQAHNHSMPSPGSFNFAAPAYDGTGYISPAMLSRDASPAAAAYSHSPVDSRRGSQISLISGQEMFQERLRTAAQARSSGSFGAKDPVSVPSSPFRPNSAYAQEWRDQSVPSGSPFDRRNSAPGLNWSTGSQAVNFSNPFGAAPIPSTYQMLPVDTGQQPAQLPADVMAASRMADERRKRNMGASMRFRQRRKEMKRQRNEEVTEMIQQLEKKLQMANDTIRELGGIPHLPP